MVSQLARVTFWLRFLHSLVHRSSGQKPLQILITGGWQCASYLIWLRAGGPSVLAFFVFMTLRLPQNQGMHPHRKPTPSTNTMTPLPVSTTSNPSVAPTFSVDPHGSKTFTRSDPPPPMFASNTEPPVKEEMSRRGPVTIQFSLGAPNRAPDPLVRQDREMSPTPDIEFLEQFHEVNTKSPPLCPLDC